MTFKRVVLVSALFVAACQSPFNGENDALTIQQRHPIAVDMRTQATEFPIAPSKFALTMDEKDKLRQVLRAYRARGNGRLLIATPSGSPNSAAAIQIAAEMTEVRANLVCRREM